MKKNIIQLLLLLLISIFLSFNSFININSLPSGIDTPAHLFKIKFIEQSLKEYGKVFFWDPSWYGGYPIASLYPPLAYFLTVAVDLLINNLTLSYNLVRLFSLFFTSLIVYYFLLKYSENKEISFLGAFLVLTSYPIFNNTYTIGRLSTSIGIIFYAVLVYLFLDLLKKDLYRKVFSKRMLLFTVLLALFFYVHPMIFYLFGITALIFTIWFLDKVFKNFKNFVKNLFFLLLIFLILIFPYLYIFIRNFLILNPSWIPYTHPIKIELLYSGVFGDTFPLYLGIFHILFFLTGVVFVLKKKSRILLSFLTISLIFFILMFGKKTPLYYFLPFGNQFDLARFQLLFSFWSSIIGCFGIKYVFGFLKERKSLFYHLMIVLIIVVVFLDISPALIEAKNWSPTFNLKMIQKLNFSTANYRGLALGFRHWDVYLLPAEFHIPDIMGWFQQADPHYDFTQTLESLGGLWYAHDERFGENRKNMTLFKNLLRLSNTKYIFFAENWYPKYAKEVTVGSYQPDHGWNEELKKLVRNDSDFRLIYHSNTLEIFEYAKNFSYCEVISPIWIKDNYYEKAVSFLSTSNAFPKIPIQGKGVDFSNNLDASVKCKRVSPEIIRIKVDKPSWVLVKESYYPFWKTKSGTKIYNGFGFIVLHVNNTEILYYTPL